MNRRVFLVVVAGALAKWPLSARAQKGPVRLIGVLMAIAENDPEGQARVAAFREELQSLGWSEGENIQMAIRWAMPRDGASRQQFAKELVALNPDIILSHATPSTTALTEQTGTTPIIFVGVSDPVGSGFVATFSQPGGNVTGFITMEPTMAEKWLELLKELQPSIERVAFLFNPETAPYVKYYLKPFQDAGDFFGIEVMETPVRDMAEVEAAIAAQARDSNGGVIMMPDTFLNAHRVEITSLAAHYRLPVVYAFRFFADAGGLASYGIDLLDQYRQAARYADRILRGVMPNELPVQSPAKFQLVINLAAARALGLEISPGLLARADEVLE